MSAWSHLRHTSDRSEILRSDVEGERIRLHAPTTFKRLLHGVVLGVSEYLPNSVPAPRFRGRHGGTESARGHAA
jgi:hypothetical protein